VALAASSPKPTQFELAGARTGLGNRRKDPEHRTGVAQGCDYPFSIETPLMLQLWRRYNVNCKSVPHVHIPADIYQHADPTSRMVGGRLVIACGVRTALGLPFTRETVRPFE
jgi:hypothetical protein